MDTEIGGEYSKNSVFMGKNEIDARD